MTDDMADEQAEPLTLRERKKRQTRQRISDAATRLFLERGFDDVTVAEIAKAADVSAMTVFNHFPHKEDLFLDRIPEAMEMVTAAVRDRGAGESVLDSLRRLVLDLLDQRHPLVAMADRFTYFWHVVLDSPALRARSREGIEQVEGALAQAIAEHPDAAGSGTAGQDPALVAALTVAAYRSVHTASARRLLAGERSDDIADDHQARVERAFDVLERGLGCAP
jgi:AcrR family transcriptional regulator